MLLKVSEALCVPSPAFAFVSKSFSDLINILLESELVRDPEGGAVQGLVVLKLGHATIPAQMCLLRRASLGPTCPSLSVGGSMSALPPWKRLSEKQLVHRCVL